MLRALKEVNDEYSASPEMKDRFRRAEIGTNKENGGKVENLYTELTRKFSLYCSVRIIDAISENDVYEISKEKIYEIIDYFNR